jgi:hypothetical protein
VFTERGGSFYSKVKGRKVDHFLASDCRHSTHEGALIEGSGVLLISTGRKVAYFPILSIWGIAGGGEGGVAFETAVPIPAATFYDPNEGAEYHCITAQVVKNN